MTPDPGDNAHILALRDQITRNCEAVQNLRGEVREMTASDTREHANINASLAEHHEQLSNIRTAVTTSAWWIASLVFVSGVLVSGFAYLTFQRDDELAKHNSIQYERIEHNARQADRNEARGAASEARIGRNEKDIHLIDGRVRSLEQKR